MGSHGWGGGSHGWGWGPPPPDTTAWMPECPQGWDRPPPGSPEPPCQGPRLTCLWLKPRPLKLLVLEAQGELASHLNVALPPLLRESFAGTERVNPWTTLLGAGAELAGAQGCTAGPYGLCCFGAVSSAPGKQPSFSSLLMGVTSGPRVHQEQDRDPLPPAPAPAPGSLSLTRLP